MTQKLDRIEDQTIFLKVPAWIRFLLWSGDATANKDTFKKRSVQILEICFFFKTRVRVFYFKIWKPGRSCRDGFLLFCLSAPLTRFVWGLRTILRTFTCILHASVMNDRIWCILIWCRVFFPWCYCFFWLCNSKFRVAFFLIVFFAFFIMLVYLSCTIICLFTCLLFCIFTLYMQRLAYFFFCICAFSLCCCLCFWACNH